MIRPPTSNPKSPKDPRLVIFCDESRRGPGSYNNLEEMAAHLGRSNEITVRKGYVEDMRLVYQALDVYVLASRGSEGSSRAALEACASGLPLIASSVGVLPDIVRDGVTGRLVKPGDVEALQAALTELFESWPTPLQWGAAARAHMESELNENRFAQKLQFVLEGMLDTTSKG
jgi:glycosyltransferase involved in cell wall biosynthesis